jgi:hypothetical protein
MVDAMVDAMVELRADERVYLKVGPMVELMVE